MPGVDFVIGESQGYQGLPVRYDFDPNHNFQFATGHNVITTYWEFSEVDQQAVVLRKPLVIRMLVAQHPPIELRFDDPGVN